MTIAVDLGRKATKPTNHPRTDTSISHLGLHAFYWYQIFAIVSMYVYWLYCYCYFQHHTCIVSAVFKTPKLFSSDRLVYNATSQRNKLIKTHCDKTRKMGSRLTDSQSKRNQGGSSQRHPQARYRQVSMYRMYLL